MPAVCGEGSEVRVDGAPLRRGASLPAASFTLDLVLDGACPLGADRPRLTGTVRLLVVRDDEAGLVPIVQATRGAAASVPFDIPSVARDLIPSTG